MDDDDEKALNIALNKISGDWDYIKLDTLLEELKTNNYDITLTGFDNLQLTDLEINLEDLNFHEEEENETFINNDEYKIIIILENHDEQERLYKELTMNGYNCRTN